MVGKLTHALPVLVVAHQSVFVGGRSIHENFMLVQQTIKTQHQKKVKSIMVKLDVGKAFDSVVCPLIFVFLRACGFGPKWLAWLATLLSLASTRVCINNNADEQFFHAQGL